MVPDRVCKLITEQAENCFIISLGSGPDAHGQLLIYHDMFGLYPRFKPRMAKVYADAGQGGFEIRTFVTVSAAADGAHSPT